jgi:hypothetical protein
LVSNPVKVEVPKEKLAEKKSVALVSWFGVETSP